VLHPHERRRAPIISIISIIFGAILIGAGMFGDHAPDPSKCDPEFRPFVTQTVSPTTITLGCFGPGPKPSPR
jgi:hypothetical protein